LVSVDVGGWKIFSFAGANGSKLDTGSSEIVGYFFENKSAGAVEAK
jgi:hypothetical protein